MRGRIYSTPLWSNTCDIEWQYVSIVNFLFSNVFKKNIPRSYNRKLKFGVSWFEHQDYIKEMM